MIISSVNGNNFNFALNKKHSNYQIFVQKPDVVSFTGKRAFSFSNKGILQSSIDECDNKEIINSLLKKEDGLYKYSPFIVFEILTQKDKPNFVENLEALQKFHIKNEELQPKLISEMLAACNGKDVNERLDVIKSASEKGIKLSAGMICTDNEKFAKIKELLEKINKTNKEDILSKCRNIAEPDIDLPISYMSPEERFFFAVFGKHKKKEDDLEKLIKSGKYKNISLKALQEYKNNYYNNYVELYKKAQSMPQVLDLINHIIWLGQHSRYKDSWVRKALKLGLKFEDVANIFLQSSNPNCNIETDLLNKLLFGKPSNKLKQRINEFTKKTGISLKTDNNIPVSYIDRYEKMLPALEHHYTGNSNIAGIYISNIIKNNSGGYCYNSGINITPSNSDFERIIFHEYAHVAHKHSIPYGGKKFSRPDDTWNDIAKKKFYPKDSIEYKTTISQLRDYATTNFMEFVAVLNEEITMGKFDVVINDKGEKVLRKYLKNGDMTTAKDLEVLMNIYASVHGPDIGAKKVVDTNLEYVETPFKGSPKFDYVKFMCQNHPLSSK